MALLEDRRRVAIAITASGAATVALWEALSLVGLAVAAAVVVTLALARASYAYAVGQVLVAGVVGLTGGLELANLLIVQLGLAALPLAALAGRWPLRSAAVAVVGFAVAGAGLAATVAIDPLWQAVAVLAVAYAVVAYGLHRYELVRLDLVAEADR